MSLLLTGATGFVGGEVLARLARSGDEPILVLVRARDQAQADERLAAVLDGFGNPAARERVRAVAGALTEPGLGVAPGSLYGVTEVVHCAASVSWGLSLEDARAINVEGTRRVLDVAERLDARRLVHVSTAYVAGRHEGLFSEDDLWTGQNFRNSYERSKAEAEQLVHERADRVGAVVVRPSIVMGDSATGWTPVFNVLYWPLRAYARGLLPAIPAPPDARVDIVPVDYVADAIVHLLRERRDVGGVINAVAGANAVSVGRLADLAAAALKRDRVRLAVDGGGLAAHSEEAAAYVSYFDMRVVFDDARAREVLRPAGIAAPPLEEYFPKLMSFAGRARWGKAPIARAAAAA
jgi:long-chain acyl-CoA synthetase